MVKSSSGGAPLSSSRPLNASQQQRLSCLLDAYLMSLDPVSLSSGKPQSVDSICQQNPDVAEAFQSHLSTMKQLHGFATGVRGAAALEAVANCNPNATASERTFRDFQLGDYKLVREIGRGGMGIVYEAHQQSIRRRVAIKVLPASAALNPRQITRFANEAQAAARLQHPGIVSIYSVGEDRGIHYYAMQLIDGTPLDAWIESEQSKTENRDLPNTEPNWKRCVTWAIEAADALHCAHENGIVHRDIKPSNLILDHADKVWITDFGLARCQSADTLTRSGDLLGTIRYMSPEQASGHSELIDHRTDIYALAATLFEILTLQPAVEGENGPSLLQKITSESPRKIRNIRSDLPMDLSVVLQKAMANSKDDRYFNAKLFADDLQAVLDDRPTVARPPSLSYLATQLARRHQRILAASAVVAAVAFLGIAISAVAIIHKSQQVLTSQIQAERYFNQARATVDHLGADVATQLASVPGAEHVRQDLLRDTLAYYEEFVLQASDDPKLLRDLAHTHHRIGVLTSELHSPSQALTSFQRAARAYGKISTGATTADTDLQVRSAENLNVWGLALVQSGKLEEAEIVLRDATSIQQALVDREPNNGSFATLLALIKNNSGLLALQQDNTESAQECFAGSIEILRGLQTRVSAAKQNFPEQSHRALAAALQNASKIVLDSDPHDAVAMLEEAISLQLELANRSSHRLRVTQDMAVMYNNLASAHSGLGNDDTAADSLQRAIALQRQLRLIAPGVGEFTRDLALSLNNLAMIRQRQSSHADAAKLIGQAITLHKSVGLAQESNIQEQGRLGAMLHNQAISTIATGDLPRAVSILNDAIRCQESVLAVVPNQAEAISFLSQHYSQLLKCQTRMKRWQDVNATAHEYVNAANTSPSQLAAMRNDLTEAGKAMPPDLRRRLPSLVASMEVAQ